jgi:hypothetical protein
MTGDFMISFIEFKYFYRLFLAVLLLLITLPAVAQGQLPEGNGRDIAITACTQCHGLNYLGDVNLTSAQWENALYDMIGRGAIVEKDDLEILRNYLVDNYATDK